MCPGEIGAEKQHFRVEQPCAVGKQAGPQQDGVVQSPDLPAAGTWGGGGGGAN